MGVFDFMIIPVAEKLPFSGGSLVVEGAYLASSTSPESLKSACERNGKSVETPIKIKASFRFCCFSIG